jgi:S1-C subfamily serine protease
VLLAVPGGPAERAGIREDDIILGIGDDRIQGQTTFTEALFSHQPGETVSVTVLRGREQRQFDVTLAERNVP